MKNRYYIYLSLLIAIVAVIIAKDFIFGKQSPKANAAIEQTEEKNEIVAQEEVLPEQEYTYLSPYARLSDYDELFREAADSIGYEWTLIAAIAFTESRFDSTVVSAAGACGVMQMMPSTLRGMKVPESMYKDNRTNVMAAARLLDSHEKFFDNIKDRKERLKFVLASYNAGYGHIVDAMNLAEKNGCNKHIWNGCVDSFLVRKSQPEYYSDPVCRNGEFNNWKQTFAFIRQVQKHWARFNNTQQAYSDSINIVVKNDKTKKIAEK